MIFGLCLLLAFTQAGDSGTSRVTLDARLTERAAQYFQCVEAGDFACAWDLSSPAVHRDADATREAFAARMVDLRPYELTAVLLAGRSYEREGVVYVRIRTVATRFATPNEEVYESHWVKADGDWYLKSLDECDECGDKDRDVYWPTLVRIAPLPN
jgi:hypothetical protein